MGRARARHCLSMSRPLPPLRWPVLRKGEGGYGAFVAYPRAQHCTEPPPAVYPHKTSACTRANAQEVMGPLIAGFKARREPPPPIVEAEAEDAPSGRTPSKDKKKDDKKPAAKGKGGKAGDEGGEAEDKAPAKRLEDEVPLELHLQYVNLLYLYGRWEQFETWAGLLKTRVAEVCRATGGDEVRSSPPLPPPPPFTPGDQRFPHAPSVGPTTK